MDQKCDLIGRNVDYCKQILAGSDIKVKFIPYHSPKHNNINEDRIIVRQRYTEDDNTLELTYCMFN